MSKVYEKKFSKKSNVIAYGPTMLESNNLDILEKFNLKKREYYLIVGRLIPDNNSKLIIESFLKSKSNKTMVVVGDVPYNDDYANSVKKLSSKKIVFTGYVSNQDYLTALYKNCYGYIHGHEYGGTNPTMINALNLNCQILALDTVFNREMLENKKSVFFNKNKNLITEKINEFESKYDELIIKNYDYELTEKYNWNFIQRQYLEVFYSLTSFQNR